MAAKRLFYCNREIKLLKLKANYNRYRWQPKDYFIVIAR